MGFFFVIFIDYYFCFETASSVTKNLALGKDIFTPKISFQLHLDSNLYTERGRIKA